MPADRQRVLVAGGTGVVGRPTVAALAAAGHDVHVLARSAAAAQAARELGATPVEGDLLDAAAVLAAVAAVRPTVVMHLATAQRDTCDLTLTNRLRADGARHLVGAAERWCAQRIVAQSVAFAYRAEGPDVVGEDAPLDTCARDPRRREAVDAVLRLEDATLETQQAVSVVLRFGALYGPRTAYAADGAIGRLASAGRLPVEGDGRALTSFVHVDDAASAAVRAAEAGWGVYNVADDRPARAAEWIPALARRHGGPPPRHVAAAPGPRSRGASNAKARAELRWTPTRPDWRVAFSTEEGW